MQLLQQHFPIRTNFPTSVRKLHHELGTDDSAQLKTRHYCPECRSLLPDAGGQCVACKTDINAKSVPFFVQLSLTSQLHRFAKGKCCEIFLLDFGTSLVIRPQTSMKNHVTLSTLELNDRVIDYFELMFQTPQFTVACCTNFHPKR